MIDPQALAAGDEGEQVEELQRRLYFLDYYTGDITGRYDDPTADAVKEFQRASSMEDDGAMSVEAWEKLETAATNAGYSEHAEGETEGEAGGEGELAPGTLSDDGQYQWDGENWQPAGGDASGDSNGEVLSEDGQYRWDGENWQPAGGDASGDSNGEVLSEDGQYRWDGENWIPVNGEQPAEQAADQSAAEAPVLSEEQFAQMISESMAISDEATA